MGQAVEVEAKLRGHKIALVIDMENADELSKISRETADVAIEFTAPGAAVGNFRKILQAGIPLVAGTTGWHDKSDEIKKLVEEMNGAMVYASNFSPGVNILFLMNKKLAELMNRFKGYDPFIEEKHHRNKKDAPSGTALSLAGSILGTLERKKKIVHSELQKRNPEENEISVSFTRSGEIIGEHTVGYVSETDEIRIWHRAYNRRGFAQGAVLAAEWIADRRGFHNFSEIIEQL